MKFRSTSGRRQAAPLLVTLATGLTLALTACGGTTVNSGSSGAAGGSSPSASANPDAPLKEGLKIAFLPKQLNNSYFTVTDRGGKTAVDEMKGSFSEVGPSEASASSQVSYINTLTQQGADVIATSANDPKAICSALDEARNGGAKVVTFDSDTDPECRDIYINQATAEGIAATQIKLISDAVGDRRRRHRHPLGHGQRHQPERLDRAHEEGTGKARIRQAQARGHRLRR
jgi:rhamnose transport system substrate-binding protein